MGRGADVIDMVAVRRTLEGDPQRPNLTAREQALTLGALAARGVSDPQLADRLGVSDRTILRWRHRDGTLTRRPSTPATDVQWSAAVGATKVRPTREASRFLPSAAGASRSLAR